MAAASDFDPQAFWRFCLQVLQTELPVQQMTTWIEPLATSYNEVEGLLLLAPNRFILQWIKTRYLERIKELLGEYCAEPITITLKLTAPTRARVPLSISPTPTAPPIRTPAPKNSTLGVAKKRIKITEQEHQISLPAPRIGPASFTTSTNENSQHPPLSPLPTEENPPLSTLSDDTLSPTEQSNTSNPTTPLTRSPLPPAIMAWTPSHTTGEGANPADEFFALSPEPASPPVTQPTERTDRPYLLHDTDHLRIYQDPSDDIEALYDKTHLNPVLTFAALVRGRANDLAHAAARQVSESPGQTYNPLFIYGGVGLGKTHILQAVGNATFQANPSLIIRYIHANDYYSDVVKAYQQGSFEHFANYYRSLDILLIDDIQFFNNKTRTQEEFFHAFNALIEAKKQVIITCDTYPKEISGLSDRLISRFDWGLTVALEPPEPEMRVAILKKKAEIEGINLDEGVAFFIAKHLRSNVRELEGALNKVLAYARFHGRDVISIDITRRALEDLLSAHNRQITIELIQKTVADYYKIKVSDLFSKRRTINITRPRQIAMALARELTSMSLPTIGEAFGGRDHTTVLHACRHIAKLRTKDPQMNHDMHVLSQTLKG